MIAVSAGLFVCGTVAAVVAQVTRHDSRNTSKFASERRRAVLISAVAAAVSLWCLVVAVTVVFTR